MSENIENVNENEFNVVPLNTDEKVVEEDIVELCERGVQEQDEERTHSPQQMMMGI